jgi:hypothetical protein
VSGDGEHRYNQHLFTRPGRLGPQPRKAPPREGAFLMLSVGHHNPTDTQILSAASDSLGWATSHGIGEERAFVVLISIGRKKRNGDGPARL